jgi:hypothetical protein
MTPELAFLVLLVQERQRAAENRRFAEATRAPRSPRSARPGPEHRTRRWRRALGAGERA